jgi:hypothetical protein
MHGNFGNPHQPGTQQWFTQQMANHSRESMQRLQDLQRQNAEFNFGPQAGHTAGWWTIQVIGAIFGLFCLFMILVGA